MLLHVRHDTPAEHRRLLLCGVVFMLTVAMMVGLAVAIYGKAFERSVDIVLKAQRAGLQLPKNGDVRLHGVLIGRVKDIAQDGKQASITLALQPSAARQVPANVSAEILPTTLFGQKFVALVPPANAGEPIRSGAVIPATRVRTNVELNRILANLFPLLRAVRPADLSTTLTALATALSGRGEEIGELMGDFDGFLTRFNTKLPTLRENMRLLADVARTYQVATPDLIRLLRSSTKTMRTLKEKDTEFQTLLADVTGLSVVTTRVLKRNGDSMIRLGELSRPLLRLLAAYSPEYPCLLQGLDRYTGRLSQIFQGRRVRQKLNIEIEQRKPYTAADKPVYGAVGHGPWCLGLPNNTPIPFPSINLADGYQDGVGAGGGAASSGFAGSPMEQKFIGTLLGGEQGRDAASYGAFSSLLAGPQLRGTRVSR
ncbi:MAG: MCE family protein [Nocardioides sp.]|jgi:phospholipid/cholesterol/gamma-HCH transport system substrate-binding protein